MEDISAIYEEEEETVIKRVYETKAVRKVAIMIKAKTIIEENLELEISDSDEETRNKQSNSKELEEKGTCIKECTKSNMNGKKKLNGNNKAKGRIKNNKNPRANSNLEPVESNEEKENYTSQTVNWHVNLESQG